MTFSVCNLQFVAFRYIDWRALITELERAGWKQADIAAALSVAPTTLAAWRNEGKEPRFSSGDALLILHRAVFGDDYTQKRITLFRESAIKASASAG
jgi:transcriptional regulator with XRE-family HTH domain